MSERITISVTDPLKHGDGMSAYITYTISTRTTIPEFGGGSFIVVRRFSDFDWLHDELVRLHPGIVVPPVPDKAVVGRFSQEFIQARRRGLEKFLVRTAVHPALILSVTFRKFLTAGEGEFSVLKAAALEEQKKARGGLLQWVSSKSSGIMSGLGSGAGGAKTAEDISFEEVNSYVTELEPLLGAVVRHTQALIKRRRDLTNCFYEFGISFSLLGQAESDALGGALTRFGGVAEKVAIFTNALADGERMYFEEPIKDFMRVITSVKEVLAMRDEKNGQLRAALSDLDAKRVAVMKTAGLAGKDKQRALAEEEVRKAQERCAVVRTEYDAIARTVLGEVERFKADKYQDFRAILLDYVNLQIAYNERLEQAWGSLIAELEDARSVELARNPEAADLLGVDGLGDKGVDLIGESAGGGSAGAGAAAGADGFEHHDSLLPAELVGGMDASGAPKLVHFM